MKNIIKVIQVFLNGSTSAEISEELVSLKFKNNCTWVTVRNEIDKKEYTTIFPLTSVSMIRLIDEEIEKEN